MATSQGVFDPASEHEAKKRPKSVPPRPKIPNRKGKSKEFDMKFHADILMRYSKSMPRRAASALDLRKSRSDLGNYANTTRYGGTLTKG